MSGSLCPVLSHEVAASGVDDALQGLTSDPWAATPASTLGLRVPTFVNSNTTRYVFQLATRQLNGRTRIRGLRQFLTIGTDSPPDEESPPDAIIEFPVTTPNFQFSDGNVSWHLVMEHNTRSLIGRPLTDSPNGMYMEADGPAFLYGPNTAWSIVSPTTGAPLFYFDNLTAYEPPQDIPARWTPIGGLGCFYDLRFPWQAASAWQSLDIPIETQSNVRISLYATVLQTNGGGSIPTVASDQQSVLPPEQRFLQGGGAPWSNGVFYWHIGGSIIFEDEDDSCPDPIPAMRRR